MEEIKIRIYLTASQSYYESFAEKEIALKSNRISMTEVTDLQFYPIVEGELVRESGEIQTRFCCVDKRELISENGKQIVIIHGHLC